MPRTSHRNAFSVNTGSSNFRDRNFFNMTSWSGLNDNKNIATIDPQSFNSCNNIYLDMNNVLCSRPAFKKNGMFDDDVVRFWETTKQDVLELTVNGVMRLKGTQTQVRVGNEISVIQVEGRVFIFNNVNCWVYEDKTFTLVTRDNLEQYIYIPEVEVYTDGNPSKFESKNMATDYVAYTHIRGVESFVDEEELDGEIVYYEDEDGNEASTLWIANITNRILLDYYTKRKFEYISMAKSGAGAIGIDNNQLFYTTNGTNWNQLPLPENRLAPPKITDDGMTALVVLPTGLYALTLVAAGLDGEAEFPTWTNICKPFIRQYEEQRYDFLNGNLRNFNAVLGLEAISYDNYVLVARGPLKESGSEQIINIYATHSSFSRLAEANGGEKLYKGMSISTSDSKSTEEIPFKTRADSLNTYTRLPICRTLSGVDSSDSVKIRLKTFVNKNSELFAILFKGVELNDKVPTGLPSGTSYYNNDGDLIANNPVTPSEGTVVSNSDKLRYSIFFLSPGTPDTNGEYAPKDHYLMALGDPFGIGAAIEDPENPGDAKNLFQRECRTYRVSIDASLLTSGGVVQPDGSENPENPPELPKPLADYGLVGTNLLIKNIGFEFMESLQETASQHYELRFFFPISAYDDFTKEILSLGFIDKSISIRNGDTIKIVTERPRKPGKDLETTNPSYEDYFGLGEEIFVGTSANFSKMWFCLRPGSTNRKIGIRAPFITDAKAKNQTEFNGTGVFLSPTTTKFVLDGNYRVSGYGASIAENSDECILQVGGTPTKTNTLTITESDIIDLLRDTVSRRMSDLDGVNHNNINRLATTSKVYKPMDPSDYDNVAYDVGSSTYYKLKFRKVQEKYMVTSSNFMYPDKTIFVSNSNRSVKNLGNKPVTDKGDYYIDCWFMWDGYYVTFEPYTYNPDAGWNISDNGVFTWYNSSSPFGEPSQANTPDGKVYSNKLSMVLKQLPYYISEKDLDRTILSPEFMLVESSDTIYGELHPAISNISDIEYFGDFTFAKNAAGFYMTSLYTLNKSFKYYYKQGREFKLRLIDGWIENSKKIYAWLSNTIYIEDRRYTRDKKPLLYIPEENVEIRDKVITAMTNFSKGVIGIFHENEVWYMYPNYDSDGNFVGYIYSKGRVGLGLILGAQVQTLYDGKTICFPTYRGVVGLQYEQLTTNEEQILTYLSDNISGHYQDFYNRSGVGCLIFQYKFWIFFWQKNYKEFLVLDVRNQSWWPMSTNSKILDFAKYKDTLYIHTEDGWGTPTHDSWYLDYDKDIISWHLESQELHFGLINYRKRILNITLQSLETDEQSFSSILTCRNFRNRSFISDEQVLQYSIDVVRTFVHRLNYINSVEFQFRLENDSSRALKEQTPAYLTAIVIKYEVGEAVR